MDNADLDKNTVYSTTSGEASATIDNLGCLNILLGEFQMNMDSAAIISYETFQDKIRVYLGINGIQFGVAEIKLKSIEQALTMVDFLRALIRRNK